MSKFVKLYDYRIRKEKVDAYEWRKEDTAREQGLMIFLDSPTSYIFINGPKTILGQFDKQMEESVNE